MLAPDSSEQGDAALGYAAQLAKILNEDAALRPGIRPEANRAPETAESVLAFAQKWCFEKGAQFFVIVLNRDLVLGSISLSHIDRESRTARTGYFLASRHQGKGYGTLALAHLLNHARLKGLKTVSARLTASPAASRRIWEKSGFPLRYAEDGVTAFLDRRD